MRLFRRRRRTAEAAYVPYVPRHAGWAQTALPPEAAAPPPPAAPPVPVAPTVPVPRATARPAPPPPGAPGVRLGFADGTEVELDGSDPSARALRTVADVIVRGLG